METFVCKETGKTVAIESGGFTFNYARDADGNYYSDEGVDIRERRELLDRSKPFFAYLSGDGKRLTGWKGNILGTVIWRRPCKLTRRSWMHGEYIDAVRIHDVHGGLWYGRGSPGIAIKIFPTKTK